MPVLACIQFFRVIVGTQDEFYLRYLVKNSLFKPVVELLVANGSRYNLLNSALLVRLPPSPRPNGRARSALTAALPAAGAL